MHATTDTSVYVNLQLDQLQESPTNPRRHFDAAALKELAASIEQHGVVQPIVVRPIDGIKRTAASAASGDGIFEIVAGARRYHHPQLEDSKEKP